MSNFLNNGQRTPNIFERARACDNWNEGNFQPQEDAKAMDLHNNSVGYYLGNQAIINN